MHYAWFLVLSTTCRLGLCFARVLAQSYTRTPQDRVWNQQVSFVKAESLASPIKDGSLTFRYFIVPQLGFSMQALSPTLASLLIPVLERSPRLFDPVFLSNLTPNGIFPFVLR